MYKVQLRYADTDQMGLIYFARHLIYADEGIMHYLKDKEINVLDLERNGIYMAVVSAHCDYKKPLKYGDECSVKVNVDKIGNTSITFNFEIYKNQELTSRGYIVYVFVNKDGVKIPIPNEIKDKLMKTRS